MYMERRVISRTSSSVFSGAVDDLATCDAGDGQTGDRSDSWSKG